MLIAVDLRSSRILVFSAAVALSAIGQKVDSKSAGGLRPTDQAGVSTGSVSTPVYDASGRPFTAGSIMPSGPAIFQDIAKKAGLAEWRHTIGGAAKEYIVDTDGSGVALLDFDNDGWLDIYLVNGSNMEAEAGSAPAPKAALFHNNHDGTFTDVAAAAGVTNDRWGYGAAIGDFDNDGWPDIYVTNFGLNRLYRNNHDGTFTDIAEHAGVQVGSWSTGATFGDYDGDGRLDLFVAGYVQFDLAHPPQAGTAATSFHTCLFRSVPVSCGPRGLEGASDHLFHNNGDGTFTETSNQAGVSDPQHYYGFTAIFADVNNDGKIDLLVANDSTPNYLYINKGDRTFSENGPASGFAYNKEGREMAGMGLAVGDYLNNGSLDLALTNFSDDYKVVYQNDGRGNFTDVSDGYGFTETTSAFLGWGVGFLDYDNDGWKDLMMLNGHLYPVVDKMHWGTSYAQRPLLFRNRMGKGFNLISPVRGSGLASITSARGAAFGDLFNNGKIDVVVNNLEGIPLLLKNVSTDQHNWVEMKLIGGAGSPRDAVGAKIWLRAAGLTQREDILSGGSFLSSNDQRAHFGLGTTKNVDQVTIYWPSGKVQQVQIPAMNTIYTIEEGKGVVKAMKGVVTLSAASPKSAKR